MRIIASLALFFGFMAQFILDGQTFSHAVFGVACGIAVIGCSVRHARQNPSHRLPGRVLAGLGVALGIWCIAILPSAYRFQRYFNSHRTGRQVDTAAQVSPDTTAGNVHWSTSRFTSLPDSRAAGH